MKRIDYYVRKKRLHEEQLGAILYLFDKAGISEIDFMSEDEWQQNCFAIITNGEADTTREVRIRKVKVEEGEIYILPVDEEKWISCEHTGKVVTATLDDLYDAVYDYVADLHHVYYVCELDENGKPTGKVTKETWRLEYAENMMEQRSFIYKDMETALLHAQRKS